MSVMYTFKERFHAKNLSSEYYEPNTILGFDLESIVATMQHQIALLCSQLLCDEEIYDITIRIEADNKITEYSSSKSKGILTVEIQEAIINIMNAKEIKISLDYDFTWRTWKDYLSIGPFVMTDLLDKCDDEIFNFIDYAMFNEADCGDGAGKISVYGKRNGAIHRGLVDYSVVNEIPSFGSWYEPQSLTYIEEGDIIIPEKNIARVTELYNELIGFSDGGQGGFSTENNILLLLLYELRLDNPIQLKKFIENFSELATLINRPPDAENHDIFYLTEFYDTSDTAPNLLRVEVNYSGDVKLSMALAF